MADASKKRDVEWNYGTQGAMKDSINCNFCGSTFNGGITRHKQHLVGGLVGGFKNVKQCTACPSVIREEVRASMQNKIANNPKFQVRQPEEYIDIDDLDDMDKYAEMMPPSKTPKISSSGDASSTVWSVTKGLMNLYFSQKSTQKEGFEKGGGIDETKKILRERAVSAFAIWMYGAGLPFNCVNHKSVDKFIETVGQHGPGMKPPTFHEVRVTHLKKRVEKVEKIVDEHKVQWTKFGCSIMMDKWTARNGIMIINILVNSPIGSVFLGSIDASNESTDSTKMYKLFESTVERIGPENVVQIVTDNASENVKVGSMMMGVYPHIYWTPCAAHCINLMFGDIFKVKPYAFVFKKAIRIHSYISQRPLLLNLMRKFTKERNLVKPAKTRFATAFLSLRAMYIQRKNLRTLVLSTEWTSSKFAKETLGKEVANLIISAHFWNDVVRALTVCGPLTKVLCLVDGVKRPPMGYIYEAMDRAKETIARGFRGVKKQYEKVFEIIDARWSDQLHRPLHAVGHVLNPGLYYKAQEEGTLLQSLWTEYYACVEKMIPDTAIQDLLVAELLRYKMADGLFGCGPAKRARDTRSPGKPSLPPHMRGNSSQSFQNFPIQLPHQRLPSIPTNYDPGRQIPVKHADQVSKRTRSPPHSPPNVVSFEKSALGLRESKRPSTSPSKLRSNAPPDSLAPQSSMSGYSVNLEIDLSKPMNFPVPKRTKFPSVSSSDQVLQYDSNHADDDIQRETEAKAKRLARFKDDLSQQNVRDDSSIPQKGPSMSQYQSVVERPKFSAEDSVDSTDDFSDGNLLADYQGLESSGVIIGSCPDMCPESERAERERKGDLDQYERLDGDRNQTSKLLAVKKYTRTAEREAVLIRPMSILQKTMDYLLNLLEQPYGESFLRLYNFLWDRMRAIRMDLRMQHIFNREAIIMLEQMIRLHILAMHELCEYTRGEGFSEGFDAHLNIEQMNKTSVELFQLYDDHRKRGINVETEREFRGYYALLKLDKHPGYKAEPAELSLDLAKMAPDMRRNPEVLFARDVARACRTGNFIAFFRLARRASYLQGCLMHAHFSKLRTQALASLHSGLQNSQGIPITQVAKWLGMEDEDIEGLLEYYGFSLKEFEEPYMVKEGPFMEVDNDYPVKCSKLVHKKKSRTIFEDVAVPHVESVSEKETETLLDKDHQQKPSAFQFLKPDSSSLSIEENMPDYETLSSPKDEIEAIPITKTEFYQKIKYESLQAPPSHAVSSLLAPPSPLVFFPYISPEVQQQARVQSAEKPEVQLQARVGSSGKPKNDEVAQFDARSMPILFIPVRDERESSPVLPASSLVEDTELKHMCDEENEDEELVITSREAETNEPAANYYDEEVAEAKLKLIIRKWKRRSLKKREMREEKQLASKTALSLLSLGVPMWPNRIQHSTTVEFNIDHAVSKWYQTQEKSWSTLNVSDVVATTLHEKNAAARCLCWKVIICCEDNNINNLNPKNGVDQLNAKSWLLSKFMPAREDEDDILITSPGLSVWRNWLLNESGGDLICCLSVIKYTNFENLNETVAGASAVLFLLSEGIPWVLQKNQLHKLLMSVPSGSQLPLLIVSELCKENADPSTIVKELELHEVHKSRLHSFSVVYLKNQQMEQLNGFFSDEQLRGGLKWLASESPPQPVLQCVKARELVLYHLNSFLGVLGEMNVCDVGPNNCISAFNKALDQSMREIAAAAHANPTCWPCPEIGLLEEHSHEHEAVTQHLPQLGWSLAPRIEQIVRAISDCKFPSFLDDTSWLHRGSDVDVKNQIIQLQSCLTKYFTEISKLMVLPLAEKEASVMMQKFVQLQLQNSYYYIVPNWVMIFQRVFNWQLMKLVKETSFSVYILIKHDSSTSMFGAVELEDSAQSHYHLSHPSLDEMVQAGRMPLLGSAMLDGEGRAFQPYPGMTSHSEEIPTTGACNEIEHGKDVGHAEFVKASYNRMKDLNKGENEPLMTIKEMKETDKLGELLDRCRIKQNMIDKNLSVYF